METFLNHLYSHLWLYLALTTSLYGFYTFYITIIKRRNTAKEALSGVDIQLKKRLDLLPNVLAITARFLSHEKELMTEVTELRTQFNAQYDANNTKQVEKHLITAETLSAKMGQLIVAVENYPDLKSDAAILSAIDNYHEVEEQLAASRRFYNAAVTDLNNLVQIFPLSLLAKTLGIAEMPFFRFEGAENSSVDAKQYLE